MHGHTYPHQLCTLMLTCLGLMSLERKNLVEVIGIPVLHRLVLGTGEQVMCTTHESNALLCCKDGEHSTAQHGISDKARFQQVAGHSSYLRPWQVIILPFPPNSLQDHQLCIHNARALLDMYPFRLAAVGNIKPTVLPLLERLRMPPLTRKPSRSQTGSSSWDITDSEGGIADFQQVTAISNSFQVATLLLDCYIITQRGCPLKCSSLRTMILSS